ncbi:hypothetical protein BLNAU_20263 [Blattamonas nauphoetae]|uniref:Uncharacterized protein n=1 Tax=Blattamonas nauphoetae TaxID=2049346 RepID=A0ABQ9WZ98_9EUKA|nr:hypothetical protein BLNAU_20263 [Blattamonas nauphoetae]
MEENKADFPRRTGPLSSVLKILSFVRPLNIITNDTDSLSISLNRRRYLLLLRCHSRPTHFWKAMGQWMHGWRVTIAGNCSPFLNWDEEEPESAEEWALIFWSLVATVKSQHVLDDSLVSKAIKLLDCIAPWKEESADAFLNSLVRTPDGSPSNFVTSISVLVSSYNQAVKIASMRMLRNLLDNCSPQNTLSLIEADLIPQLINTLNPLPLSFEESVDIHACLISIITSTTWLATQMGLDELENEHPLERQTIHQTVLDQILIPSEVYLLHLCVNRNSIVDGDQSSEFMLLLGRLLHISPYYQPTLDFILNLPVFLTIPSCLTFFETDAAIAYFFMNMLDCCEKWNDTSGAGRPMGKTVDRMLRMEGFDDVIEQRLRNDKIRMFRSRIVAKSIEWSNLQGINLSAHE